MTGTSLLVADVRPKDAQAAHAESLGLSTLVDVEIGTVGLLRKRTVNMRMAFIPPGEFLMGSPEDEEGRRPNEGPLHRVGIEQGFYMGIYSVTQEQLQSVMGNRPSGVNGDENPVEHINWYDCRTFARKLSDRCGVTFRLPTEAEWEYASRAGAGTKYHFGGDDSELDDYVWYRGNCGRRTHPVGEKRPNGWGLYDMCGNVWEWCQSLSRPYPYRADDGREDVSAFGRRVLRGGSRDGGAADCRSAVRIHSLPGRWRGHRGFRVVMIPLYEEIPYGPGRAAGVLPRRRSGLSGRWRS